MGGLHHAYSYMKITWVAGVDWFIKSLSPIATREGYIPLRVATVKSRSIENVFGDSKHSFQILSYPVTFLSIVVAFMSKY